jgi:ssDNA-binding Zn-finger/Zn-ribbon topoisomerase 1
LVTRAISKGDNAGKRFLACNNWRKDDPTSCKHAVWPKADSPSPGSMAAANSNRGTPCPKCGKGNMVERTIKNGANAGKTFFSCTNWRKAKRRPDQLRSHHLAEGAETSIQATSVIRAWSTAEILMIA